MDRAIERFEGGAQRGVRAQPPPSPGHRLSARGHGWRGPQVVEDIRADRRKNLPRFPDGEFQSLGGQCGRRGFDHEAAAHQQVVVAFDHGIKRSGIAEIVRIGGRRAGRNKVQVVGHNPLGRPGRRGQTRFDVGLARRLVVAVIGRMQDLEAHQSRRIWWLMKPSAMTSWMA